MENSTEILVVDDTPANLEVITEILASAGYKVAAVTSGERALKRLQTYVPDLILLDIQMRGIDGFETCRQLKANPDTANIPVIFITVYADAESISQGFSLGAVDYITKPFQEAELLARVKIHLQLQSLTRGLEEQVAERTTQLQIVLEQLQQSQLQQIQLNQALEQANQQLADYSYSLERKVETRTDELKVAQQRILAQEKLASLGTLTAGVAHELRNPLNFVKNYAEGSIELSQELLDTLEPIISTLDPETLELTQSIIDDLQENATTICNHSVRATQIIQTMMQHTHVEYKPSIPQATHLHDLLDQAVKLAYHSKKEQYKPFNPSIRTNYAANLDLIKVIPSTFIRALLNLMDNAFDAMGSKQNQLRANSPLGTTDYTPTLWIETHLLSEEVEIRIRDNGCGIEPGIKSKILDPFFTTKPPGEGTGLGLSLTQDIIVKQHQASINIDSKLSEFTEVTLRLPN